MSLNELSIQQACESPMASTSTQSLPSTCSSSTDSLEYEVFLSFRGVDTRHTFADALYHAMKNIGIIVFRDKEDLEVGEEINPALARAIKESSYAVVVISPQFAKSKACLFELTAIMKCMRMGRLKVFPVFYHVNPSELGELMKDVENIFTKPEGNPSAAKAKWENWKSLLGKLGDYSVDPELDKDLPESCRRALKEASDLSAMVVGKDSYETEMAQEISLKIFSKLVANIPVISEHLVGIESRVIEIMKLLNIKVNLLDTEVDPVRVIGICGIGGIGKTILAEVIYTKVSPHFRGRCFIYHIGRKIEHRDLVEFQKQLISNILGKDVARSLDNDHKVKEVLRTKLRKKKAFIVLDDVWEKIQVDTLAGSLGWFGHGSRILITSRNHRLPHLHNDNVYEVKELDDKDALELFCWKAFNQPHPKEGFERVIDKIVHKAQCLPFALDTFGSYLSGRDDKDEWNAYENELDKNLEENVSITLQKSFDALDHGVIPGQVCKRKELFLDIACFFNGCLKNDIIHILEAFGYNHIYDLGVLKDKSLIRISNDGRLLMHDFLVKLGQQVAKSSRLLQTEDIITALSTNTVKPEENCEVQGIVLKLPLSEDEQLSLESLSAMVNLRVLQIKCNIYMEYPNVIWDGDTSKFSNNRGKLKNYMYGNVGWEGDISKLKLSKKLCIIEWCGYPLESLPLNFAPTKLVELKLPRSRIERLWVGQKMFRNLRCMKLSGSENLIEIPNFQGIPNLEILDLTNCECLSKVDTSLGLLKQLRELRCKGCIGLTQCSEVLANCLSSLSALEILDLTLCGLSDAIIPSDLSGLGSLKSLCLLGNNFKRIPESIYQLSALEQLLIDGLYNYKPEGLESHECLLPQPKLQLSGLRCLQVLNLSYLNLPDEVISNDIRYLSSLENLCLTGNDFEEMPDVLYELSNLRSLTLDNLPRLKTLPKLPLSLVEMVLSNCPSLEMPYNVKAAWNSSEILRTTDCSLLIASIGYDGKPSKMLLVHPECPLWTNKSESAWQDRIFEVAVACGPVQEAEIPKWFNKRSICFSETIDEGSLYIDLDDDLKNWRGFALFIIYQAHDKSTFPVFVSQIKVSHLSKKRKRKVEVSDPHEIVPVVFCVPELPSNGLNGVWVYIPVTWFREQLKNFNNDHNLRTSIAISSLNVELKEYGMHMVYEHDLSKFYDVLTSISTQGVDSGSAEEFFSDLNSLDCLGNIKANGISW